MTVAVVGGGVSGLAAAHRLRALLGPAAAITVLERRDRLGGVLRTVDLAGVPFDVGAEAFLARRPEVPALLAELGLGAPLAPTGARTAGGPVFGAVPGGYRALLDALAAASAADVRLGTTVRALQRRDAGWRLVLGPATAPEALDVDAVLLAVPAPAVARLLADAAPAAARAAGEVELASSAVVALAYPAPLDLPTSGVLVAAGEPLHVKGVTHSSTKWAHLGGDGLVRLRASLGRSGGAAALQVDDAELVARVRADLRTLAGITAEPVAVHVQRWGGGLPQYGVGHLARAAAIGEGLPAGLAVAGAALHGVGVPACVATARAAAERLAAGWRD